ncbi:NAD(P)-dependent oxidoreductase [Sphingobacterium mizutaii NBRC 14946 = DSM 11724]|uniref:dTDP-4-dehydrorhamnose reductase n=2 Tax=Sphingobacterium mizutaii TaxID=1010 RepID=A0AAJ4XET8_9SPHI|nr:dTDP-4-dehydrorhamnose reductase [Sphingobacterium mizutaii]GEM66495.1 NAD(P)-dependent oxidoreductase [Sphingobacterium mizutaii NBRC 14946 = DSM 11724]SDL52990.1 dTDP-4-dehydrorhamnose reductase [Sphingobacterium mizutaii]SNV62795.1 dTDP-4-dehydrorhamnose reductase [Sphingobacterium mizutaii]
MLRILVTGVNGQLGSELKELLAKEETFDASYLSRAELPLEKTETIRTILSTYKPDIIIHSAAYTAVDKAESEIELADKVNHIASKEIANYCKSKDCKLISISTDYVFDGNSNIALKENAEVDPINIYGKTKLLGEKAIEREYPDAILIRTSWVYSTYGNNFVKTMIRLMSEREEISVINDQIGSPTYARDLAKAILKIIKSDKWVGGIFHYSNDGEISWYDFAEEIKKIKGFSTKINPIPTSSYPTPAKRPKFSLLDQSKIQDTYNVDVPFWKDSLKEMINLLK